MPTSIPALGPILHLVGVCVNRIGTGRTSRVTKKPQQSATQLPSESLSLTDVGMQLSLDYQWSLEGPYTQAPMAQSGDYEP